MGQPSKEVLTLTNFHIVKINHLSFAPLPKVPWRWLSYFTLATPKARMIVWFICWMRRPTMDRLHAWELNVDPIYSKCQCHRETTQPLFLDCSFTKQFGEEVMKMFPNDSPAVTIARVSKITSKRSIMAKTFTTVWIELY